VVSAGVVAGHVTQKEVDDDLEDAQIDIRKAFIIDELYDDFGTVTGDAFNGDVKVSEPHIRIYSIRIHYKQASSLRERSVGVNMTKHLDRPVHNPHPSLCAKRCAWPNPSPVPIHRV